MIEALKRPLKFLTAIFYFLSSTSTKRRNIF